MGEAAGTIATNTTNSLLEQGIMGSVLVLFFITSAILFYVLLKDKKYQETIGEALKDMVENQKSFTRQYETSQQHHKEVLDLIADTSRIERQNTKDCYDKVESHLNKLLMRKESQ